MRKVQHSAIFPAKTPNRGFSGKPENDLGQKMVQVCIKENDPGFQNIEIDRKMV